MGQIQPNLRRTRRNPIPAVVVTVVGMLLVLGSHLLTVFTQPGRESDQTVPLFPSTVASYSWWTPQLAPATVDAALMVYQNGVGVEFLDLPQAVLLGTDGSTYRRLGAAEALSIPVDQGDPAETRLSPDGSFVVIAGAGGDGEVQVMSLADGAQRSIPIGAGRSAIPVGIGADSTSVLLLTSDASMSPLSDMNFRLHGTLGVLDLESGNLREYPGVSDVNSAALSPDGESIAADTENGIILVDVADGSVVDTGLGTAGMLLDGDAFSPDGVSFGYLTGDQLTIVDTSATTPVGRTVALQGTGYGSLVGWRDDRTALLHWSELDGSNASHFAWVDVDTGEQRMVSDYTTGFTGAALAGPDLARDLVATMQVQDRGVDQGVIPVVLALVLVGLLGVATWRLTPRRPRVAGDREPRAGTEEADRLGA